jgi:oligoribonuclease (3'-5' exoribonuclease)
MKLKYYCSILLLFIFLTSMGQTADCTLGIGGKDTETIIKVFQLSEEQLVKMEGWIQQLNKSNELIEEQIDVLLDQHPQSNEEELQVLAEKFKPLRAQIIANSRICDQKLIGILNENQYRRYIDLCTEAIRRPLKGLISKEDMPPE